MSTKPAPNAILRNLPSVDELLRSDAGVAITAESGTNYASVLARHAIDTLRSHALNNSGDRTTADELLKEAEGLLRSAWKEANSDRIRRVINATGVIIHTNLGRAPLSPAARRAVADEAAGYCTLEYDLSTGKRGRRAPLCEQLITELTGAEAALVVNNCAAAAFFVLTVFATGGSVVISRGELVEIGGDFRVPDVLSQSGSTLREVGTTNRTSLKDYQQAIDADTRMLLRVHPSNYRITGFTFAPSIADLARLAHEANIVLYEDIGSGALVDLSGSGINDDPIVAHSINAGADIVTFSGDKLVGGPQAGIIAGRRKLIDQLRRHPLFRALRVDKLVYAALEATLSEYRRGTTSAVPVISMLSETADQIGARARKVIDRVNSAGESQLTAELLKGISAVGGGAAPAVGLESQLISIKHSTLSSAKLEQALRESDPPLIARIEKDKVLLDLRTVTGPDEDSLIEVLLSIA